MSVFRLAVGALIKTAKFLARPSCADRVRSTIASAPGTLRAVAPPNGTCSRTAAETVTGWPPVRWSLLAAAWVLISSPLARPDQTAAEAAVASVVQGRKACGETPSTSALCPLTVTFPPLTGSTAATPPSFLILASCAAVIPPGAAAMRSGTSSCRELVPAAAEGDADGPAITAWPSVRADETCEEGVPPATAASAAWAAGPARPAQIAAAAAMARTARGRGNDGTMFTTL